MSEGNSSSSQDSSLSLKTAIISGVLVLLGTIGGGIIRGYWDIDLAEKKFESDLILKALESSTGEERAKTLKFLKDIELISRINTNKLETYLRSPQTIPEVKLLDNKFGNESIGENFWGIVAGGTSNIEEIKNKKQQIEKKGYQNIVIYKKGTYRVVIKYNNKKDANNNLESVKKTIEQTAYVINLENWCLGPANKEDIIECQSD